MFIYRVINSAIVDICYIKRGFTKTVFYSVEFSVFIIEIAFSAALYICSCYQAVVFIVLIGDFLVS